tara:strand:- start:1704 stop:2738 length:1035 start_codon:yes stop_codon:yes gene_type:complete
MTTLLGKRKRTPFQTILDNLITPVGTLGKRKRSAIAIRKSKSPTPKRLSPTRTVKKPPPVGTLGKRKRSTITIRKSQSPVPKRLNQTIRLSPTRTVKKPTPVGTLGKRKRSAITIRKSQSPVPKRLDVGDTGDIVAVADKYAKFVMSKQLVAAFRDLSYESSRKMIEYAGKIDILQKPNLKVKMMTPTKMTSYLRGAVQPSPSLLSTRVTYHSHPSPRQLKNNVNEFKNYHSLPSNADIIAYYANYPQMQANIILDTNGYYVIDLVEGENHDIEKIIKVLRLYIEKRLAPYYREIDGYQYFEASNAKWKDIVNNSMNKVMRRNGVSIKYYNWNERGIITLTISR